MLAFLLPKCEKCHSLLGEMYPNLVRTGARKCFDTCVCRMNWDLVERTSAPILLSPSVLKTKFHISCCDTESNSKLKFIFHVAAISGLILSSRAEIPKPSVKDGPDKRGCFLWWNKIQFCYENCSLILSVCLFIEYSIFGSVYIWGEMLYCKSLSEIRHYVVLLSVCFTYGFMRTFIDESYMFRWNDS